jgi:RNA polymerase sigma factor for flagellar operon FliA
MTCDLTARQVSNSYIKTVRSSAKAQERISEYIAKFLPIVKSEVLRFKMRVPRHVEFDELHGVAICGFMRAFERYNEGNEFFGAYVRKRVRGAILDELRSLDTMSRSARKKARLYDDAVLKIEQREGRLATEEEIRIELGLELADFNHLLDQLSSVTFFSLNDLDTFSESGSLVERLEDKGVPLPSEAVEMQELFSLIRARLSHLPERQRKILHMYYFKDFRLAEIAKIFDISESRVCQLHAQAIRALKIAFSRQSAIENQQT